MLHHHFHPATKRGLLYTLDVFWDGYALQTTLKRAWREKSLKKNLILNILEKQRYAGENCSYEYKRVLALVDWEKKGGMENGA